MKTRGLRYPRVVSRRRSSSCTLVLTVFLSLSMVLLVLLALGILSIPIKSKDAPKVELRSDRSIYETQGFGSQKCIFISMRSSEFLVALFYRLVLGRGRTGQRGEQWVEVISWEPRAFVYHNFLSKEECKYLIELAKPHMEKSTVVDSATGQSKDSRVRTSSGTFLRRGRDKMIRSIEKRLSDFTFLPVENGEGLQILHYEVGQKYEPHYDYFLDELNAKNGGQRIATVLMYLSDVEEGGETVFPSAKVNSSSLPWHNELSVCGKGVLSVKPKMGDALLFWSMKPDATLDPFSLHGGCPVIRGNKWSSTKWFRVNEFKM